MSKFNVGDRVRIIGPKIRKDSWDGPAFFEEDMGYLIGKIGVIEDISKAGNFFVFGWYWAPEWLEPATQCTLGDPVKPEHYRVSDIEPIDAIEAWELGFCLGNVVKYVARHAHKEDPLGDLKKAAWYLDRAIKEMKKTGGQE